MDVSNSVIAAHPGASCSSTSMRTVILYDLVDSEELSMLTCAEKLADAVTFTVSFTSNSMSASAVTETPKLASVFCWCVSVVLNSIARLSRRRLGMAISVNSGIAMDTRLYPPLGAGRLYSNVIMASVPPALPELSSNTYSLMNSTVCSPQCTSAFMTAIIGAPSMESKSNCLSSAVNDPSFAMTPTAAPHPKPQLENPLLLGMPTEDEISC
mmetsp:Transcript_36086/g.90560  ORF Transcript_36086/g.90560 Transcript_36086/m.90560 type:complete len:212 (+) Transcript_36086:63-698(+)